MRTIPCPRVFLHREQVYSSLTMTAICLSLIAVLCVFQQALGKLTENGSVAITGLKNNTIVIVKNSDTDNTPLIIGALTVTAAAIPVFIGFQKWITEQRQNRAARIKELDTRTLETVRDIVMPLISQFDRSQEMVYAKQILDAGPPEPEKDWEYPKDNYSIWHLNDILRDHKVRPITDPGEIAIRKSFDELLDFFAKLEYLFSINLLTSQQLEYFRYYINKASNEDAVVNYVRTYSFPLHGKLDSRLNSD